MRIVKNQESKEVDFGRLMPGTCFKAFGKLYIKSKKDQDATALTDGEARINMCGIYVTPIDAEVHTIS